MAKSKKTKTKMDGPYLAAAFLCESTIEDARDHAISVIRMIDKLEFLLPPSFIPSEENRVAIPLNAFLGFKTGESQGDHVVRLVLESPAGTSDSVYERPLTFTAHPNGGANLRLGIQLMAKEDGLHNIHVFLDDRFMTKMPFQVAFRKLEAEPDNQHPPSKAKRKGD